MNDDRDYIQDITEMRSMMERSSKFLWLSGLAGVVAGIYALAGAFIAYRMFHFDTQQIAYDVSDLDKLPFNLVGVIFLAITVLALSFGTAVLLSYKRAHKRRERLWNATVQRVLFSAAVPLVAGGLLILVLLFKGLIGLAAPLTMIFYGLAQYNASKYTYDEMRGLGIILIILGLLGSYFVEYGLLLWAIGFGLVNIIYGVYIHYRFEK